MRLKTESILSDARVLMTFFANNKGRGKNNCTLIITEPGITKPRRGCHISEISWANIDKITKTSAWRGDINISERVCKDLGITKKEIENCREV